MSRSKPVLELTSKPERALVKLGAKTYELKDPSELNLLDLVNFKRKAARVVEIHDEVLKADNIGDYAEELSRILREMVATVFVAPKSVLDRLTDGQRGQIVRAFRQTQATPEGEATPEAEV